MNLTTLISVILPCYKHDDYFSVAINSILVQTYSNLELIIIDDSHDDLIKNTIVNFNDKRIKYFKGNNKGISSALNIGIEKSSGMFIARMDADDISLKSRFETQLNYIIKYNLDICGSNIKLFGAVNQNNIFPEANDDIKFHFLIGCPIAHPTVFAKANLYKKYKYNEELFASEDYDLWCRMAYEGVKFGNVQNILLEYRTHESQASKLNSSHKESVIRAAKGYSKKYLAEQDYIEFSSLNYGLDTNYSTKEVYDLSFLIKKIIDQKGINSITLKRYINSLHIRIEDVSFKSIFLYLKTIKKYKFNPNPIILLYLLINCFIKLNPLNNRFSFIRKLF